MKPRKERSTSKWRYLNTVVAPAAIMTLAHLFFEHAELSEVLHGNYEGEQWETKAKTAGATTIVAAMQALIRDERDKKNEAERPLTASEQRAIIENIAASPLGDTLQTLLGQPAIHFGYLERTEKRAVLGRYVVEKDEIILTSTPENWNARNAYDLRFAYIHEMAHAWQARQGDLIGAIWQKYDIQPPRQDRINYASRSRLEHQAEAIASALGYLDILTYRQLTESDKVMFGNEIDKIAPGTLIMARIFLSHPVYAEHPYKGKMIGNISLVPLNPPVAWALPQTPGADERESQQLAALEGGPIGLVTRVRARWAREYGAVAERPPVTLGSNEPGKKRIN